MAEAAVGRLVHHISAEEHHVQKSRGRRLGRRGLHVTHTPQFNTAAADDVVVVGAHQYVKPQMHLVMDSFFRSAVLTRAHPSNYQPALVYTIACDHAYSNATNTLLNMQFASRMKI